MYYWMNSENIHVLWVNLWVVFINSFVQLFMPYLNFEYTKVVTCTVENIGNGIGQDPATEVTHLGLNQPSVFLV